MNHVAGSLELHLIAARHKGETMNGQHTAGPWILNYHTGWSQATIYGDCGKSIDRIAKVGCTTDERKAYRPNLATIEANARLIAAAPDLLAACEALLPWAHLYREGHNVVEYERVMTAAWAAIAKAKGTK